MEVEPIHINCHSGLDDFSFQDAVSFFKSVEGLETKVGLKCSLSHETHRGRILFSPWRTLELIKEIPSLKFTLDLSHWVVVSERLIEIDRILPVLERTLHIHARLATPQASQVSNPNTMDTIIKQYFEKVWLTVWKSQARSNVQFLLDPEYGPLCDSYMPNNTWFTDGKVTKVGGELDLDELIISEGKRLFELHKMLIA
ncbi:hypothetical protein BC833DRAFT_603343 [Globomyces pollinis-pini]|nr:hypothetical protein BC833DRAFT_603343 [Globomyces pollinis-pini]